MDNEQEKIQGYDSWKTIDMTNNYYFYKTTNMENGNFYYGVHNGKKKWYKGSGVALRAALSKYGYDSFLHEKLMENLTKDEAYELEELVVDNETIKNPMCYNMKLGGEFSAYSPTAEHRKAVSEYMSNRKVSDETRRRMSESQKGKKKSEETKEKIRQTLKKRYGKA